MSAALGAMRRTFAHHKLLFWAAVVNVFSGLDTYAFWVGFFTETTFPIDELRPLIAGFDGYYAWEKCFVVPDVVLATTAIFASIRLLTKPTSLSAVLALTACSGAWGFLGVLDLTYGLSNGMYTLGHPYSLHLLSIGIGLPAVASFTLFALHRSAKRMR